MIQTSLVTLSLSCIVFFMVESVFCCASFVDFPFHNLSLSSWKHFFNLFHVMGDGLTSLVWRYFALCGSQFFPRLLHAVVQNQGVFLGGYISVQNGVTS
jgi:hypothetical protein